MFGRVPDVRRQSAPHPIGHSAERLGPAEMTSIRGWHGHAAASLRAPHSASASDLASRDSTEPYRSHAVDVETQHCADCGGGEFKIIAAILEQSVIEKIIKHLGLRARASLRASGWMTASLTALNRSWRRTAMGRFC